MRRSLNDVRDARMKVPADEQQRVRFYFSLLFACRKRPSTHFELVYMFTFLRIDSSGTFLSLGQTPRVNRNSNACNFQFDFSIQNWSSESSESVFEHRIWLTFSRFSRLFTMIIEITLVDSLNSRKC